ncbi:MAG TPA: CehA/McbA family metallohydrolase [Gemmataceae bacterium]|nr:CehA/McbA family metallohydrolase [Gemmataceae bacterium]
MLTVHVRVSDAATGKPTPVRIRFIDSAGVCRMPFGRLTAFAAGPGEDVGGHVQLGGDAFAYINGNCEVHLPPGPVRVEVHKGPEYVPINREIVLGPGKIAMRLAIARWIDPRPQGWFSGDGRAHELSPHAAQLEGAAEGLDVVNLLAHARPPQGERPAAFINLLEFSGTKPALDGSPLVVVNTYNSHPILGILALLNCHRIVHPLRFGAPDSLDDWSISDWCDQCHRKSGLVVWPDTPRLTADHPQGEALAVLLLSKIDAFEICHMNDPQSRTLSDWYRLLACGQRLPLVGASGKDSNRVALGAIRTYARLEPNQEFGYGTWIEAVRAGRTFATAGPLLSLMVDGHDLGSMVFAPEGKTVHVRAEARSAMAFNRLELLHNGSPIATATAAGDPPTASIEMEVPVLASGWLAARCWGGDNGSFLRAHTSPVYLQVEGKPVRPDAATIAPLLAALDQTLTWVRREARCANEAQREQLAENLQTARRELMRRCP